MPNLSSFPSFAINSAQSVSGRILALAVAPSDNTRLYAGAYSGIWRSDDSATTIGLAGQFYGDAQVQSGNVSVAGRGVSGIPAISGENFLDSDGVRGINGTLSVSSAGVHGVNTHSPTGLAGLFDGNVQVNGNFSATGTKAFVQAHPSDPSREIVYVALEGGEAGTYVRGSGQLQSGKAMLALPEHFALVTATEGLTVQLTPRGEWLQLYVVELDTARLVVREAQGKSGAFDYLIHGVRRGYEQHEVIRTKR